MLRQLLYSKRFGQKKSLPDYYFIIKICFTDLILLLPESGQEAAFLHGIKKTVLPGHSLLKIVI